jgi:pimeloyl-ACP methyl ester carboxylesterase
MASPTSGRATVNGVAIYYEIHGETPHTTPRGYAVPGGGGLGGEKPLVLLHGGVNPSEMFGAPLTAMAETQQVIAIHMRGHGFSSEADVPWTYEQMADDVGALLDTLGLEQADVMGWSLGGGVALQTAIRHPARVGKLVVISMSIRYDGNFPEIQAQFEAMPDMAPEYARQIEQSPLAEMYPDVDWDVMMRKTGEMNRAPYDWSADVAQIATPTLLMFADADIMPPEHMVEIYKLLGGGTRDAGLDGSLRPTPNQLAIMPGTTHYNLMLTATKSATDFAKAFLAQ